MRVGPSSRVVVASVEDPDEVAGVTEELAVLETVGCWGRFVDALVSALEWTWKTWGSWQLCHQGKYSIERLMAMDNYYRTTSVPRMLLVCVATPLPALTIAILLELIPLQSSHAGSFANWGFWIRHWVTLFIMILAMTTQVKVIIPELPFTTFKCLMISTIATSIYIGAAILIGGYIVFPIPFMAVLGGVPGVAIACTMVVLVLRIRPSAMSPAQRNQLQRFFRICFSSGLLLIAYPAYNAAFVASSTTAQSLLIVALQVMKLGAKNVTAKALSHLEDYLPEYVVFLVEVFNALYLTACMQNANSTYMIVLITGMDYAQSLWELYTIKTRANTMGQLFEACWKRDHSASKLDLIEFAIYICRKADKINRKEARQINLRACLKHSVSAEHAKLLDTLETQNVFSHGGREHRQSLFAMNGSRVAVITPLIAASTGRKRSSLIGLKSSSRETTRRGTSSLDSFAGATGVLTYIQAFKSLSLKDQRSTKLLLETLQSLFHVECVVLVEYVECVVPFIYFIYTAARSQLPSNAYYPNRRHIPERSFDWMLLGNVALYTGLEFLSFVILNMLYWWKFRFLPLYQLAFVLDNQLELVQSKLVLWVVFLLQFELYHYGADFTFRFTFPENK